MKPEFPTVTVELSKLEPGQPFTFDGKRYVMPDADSRCWAKNAKRIYYQFPGIAIYETVTVELILNKKEFREMESGQEFYDEHGKKFRKLEDNDYRDSGYRRADAVCYCNNTLRRFDLHDPVFVVVKN